MSDFPERQRSYSVLIPEHLSRLSSRERLFFVLGALFASAVLLGLAAAAREAASPARAEGTGVVANECRDNDDVRDGDEDCEDDERGNCRRGDIRDGGCPGEGNERDDDDEDDGGGDSGGERGGDGGSNDRDDDGDDEPASTAPPAPPATATPIAATPTAGPSADLSVTVNDSADPVTAGNSLVYYITVTNHGPSGAGGVSVVDSLPTGVVFVSAAASRGSCNGTRCELGALNAGQSVSVSVTTDVPRGMQGSIRNSVCASSGTADHNQANNCDNEDTGVLAAPTPVETAAPTTPRAPTPTPRGRTPAPTPTPRQQAELTVTNVDAPDPVAAGSNLTYFITVKNRGSGPADGVIAAYSLPEGAAFRSGTPSRGSCRPGGCSLGILGGGAEATISLTAQIDTSVRGPISSEVCVSTTSPETNRANNCDSEATLVTAPRSSPPGEAPAGRAADLSIAMVDSPDPVAPGGRLTYGITVTNHGPDLAPNVSMRNALPGAVSLLGTTTSLGSCAGATCSFGDIGAGGTATVTVALKVSGASGSIKNTACVSGGLPDPDTSNNCADAWTRVQSSGGTAGPGRAVAAPDVGGTVPGAGAGGEESNEGGSDGEQGGGFSADSESAPSEPVAPGALPGVTTPGVRFSEPTDWLRWALVGALLMAIGLATMHTSRRRRGQS